MEPKEEKEINTIQEVLSDIKICKSAFRIAKSPEKFDKILGNTDFIVAVKSYLSGRYSIFYNNEFKNLKEEQKNEIFKEFILKDY